MPTEINPSAAPLPQNQPSEPEKTTFTEDWNNKKTTTVPDSEPQTKVSESDTESDFGYSSEGSPLSDRSLSTTSSPETSGSSFDKSTKYDFPPSANNPIELPEELSLYGGDVDISKPLGRGRHGKVLKVTAYDKDTQSTTLAMKQVADNSSLNREQSIMEQLPQHPNIVTYHGKVNFDQKDGLLFDCIRGRGSDVLINTLCETPMPVDEFINVLKFLEQQKLKAVAHAGKHGIVHSDLKPSNFLYDTPSNQIKLIDFGASTEVGAKIACGHENFTAPEALQSLNGRKYGPEAEITMDSYALGQMLYQTVTGLEDQQGSPFMFGAKIDGFTPGQRMEKAFRMNMASKNYLKPDADGNCQKALPLDQDQISKMALKIEQIRPGSNDPEETRKPAELLTPQLEQMVALINGLMHPSPEKRLTAEQALKSEWLPSTPPDWDKALKTINNLEFEEADDSDGDDGDFN